MQKKQKLAIALVLLISTMLAVAIWFSRPQVVADPHQHEHGAAAGHEHEGKHAAEAGHDDEHDAEHEHEHEGEHEGEHKGEHEHAAAQRLRFSDAQLQQHGVTLAKAGPAQIAEKLQLAGEIHVDAERTLQIVPRVGGVVEQAPVAVGSVVRKGQLLAVLSSPSLAEWRAEAQAAQKRLELARLSYRREQQLWQERISAEQDYQQARHALQEAEISASAAQQKLAALAADGGNGKQLARYEIRAPQAGTLTDKRVAIGAVLQADTPIFTISDLSSVWAEATVPARDLPRLKPGQVVSVSASAYAASGNGTLMYVGSMLGEQSRNASARIRLDNRTGIWRPGLPVSIEVVTGGSTVPVAVAAAAVQDLGNGPVVFGRDGDYLLPRSLTLGRSDGRMVEVQHGLPAGALYVSGNSFLIKADIGKAAASHEH